MPSAITKQPLDNGASLPQETSIQAAIAIVEKKVRNLEKRKGKLDSYRDILRGGKALNEDQQSAVDKYDEVMATLDFTKELMGQFNKLASDEAKDKKKIMRKELQEKSRDELSKVSYVLGVREILALLKEEKVLADLKSGTRGAPKMTGEQLAQLQQFGEIVNPLNELKDNKGSSFNKQVNISAEHFLHLAEMKNKSVAGTTYQDLNNLLSTIRESGYLEGRWTSDQNSSGADVDQEDEEEEEEEVEVADNGIEANGHHTESNQNQKMLGQSSTNEPDEPPAVFPSQGTPETVPAPAPVKQEPSFNFLQESQIDLESPHMDPAVVMVHPAKRPVQPPGLTGQQADQARQMIHHLQLHQHQALLEAQGQGSAENKLTSGHNQAFDGPTVTNGVSPQSNHPPFVQSKEVSAPGTDPRAPRVPDGTPQHTDPSPTKTSPPSSRLAYNQTGYAAAAGGAGNKVPDNEIGTWKPEGEEEEEEGRGPNGERRRGRGGGRGYGGGRGGGYGGRGGYDNGGGYDRDGGY